MLKQLKKIDLFGHELDFEYQSYNKYKTVTGAILSLMIIIITLVISLLFGQEIFLRKNPKVTMNQIYEMSSILLKDFHYAIGGDLVGVLKSDGKTIFDYFDFIVSVGNVYSIPKVVNCTEKHFREHWNVKGVQEFVSRDKTKCLELSEKENNKYIQNKIRDFNESAFMIIALNCNERFRRAPCPKDLKEVTANIIFEFNYINTYIDSSNQTHPVQYYLDTFVQSMNPDYFKKNSISFTEDIYETGKISIKLYIDNGWLLEDKKVITYINRKDITSDLQGYIEGLVYRLGIQTIQLKNHHSRSYMKVQDLLANIGGVFNSCYLVIYALSYQYFNLKYKVDLWNHHLEESKRENNLKNNITNLLPKINPNNIQEDSKIKVKVNETIGIKEGSKNKVKILNNHNLNDQAQSQEKQEEHKDKINDTIGIKDVSKFKIPNNQNPQNVNKPQEDENIKIKISNIKDFHKLKDNVDSNFLYEESVSFSYLRYLFNFICCCRSVKSYERAFDFASESLNIYRFVEMSEKFQRQNLIKRD